MREWTTSDVKKLKKFNKNVLVKDLLPFFFLKKSEFLLKKINFLLGSLQYRIANYP